MFSEALSTRSRNPLILFQIRDRAGQRACNLLKLLDIFCPLKRGKSYS